MSDFQDKVVLITGAGGGFGAAVAKALAAEGACVALNDLTPVNLDPLMEVIEKADGEAEIFLGDVSKKLTLQTMLDEILQKWERIDILVNHASVQPHDPLLKMDEYDWRRTIDVILTGTFLTMQSVGRIMRELGGGVILNIGPVIGEAKEPRPAYLAGKAAVVALTQAAAEELGEYNIDVNALYFKRMDEKTGLQAALDLCRGGQSGKVTTIN